jgi:hypothetical protein
VLPLRPARQISAATDPLPARPVLFRFRDRFGNAPEIRRDVVCAAEDVVACLGVAPKRACRRLLRGGGLSAAPIEIAL